MRELTDEMVELAEYYLNKDTICRKKDKKERGELIDFAVNIGESEGTKAIDWGLNPAEPGKYIEKDCEIREVETSPSIPIYSEIILEKNIINIYTGEIDSIIDGLELTSEEVENQKLYNVFALHEYFHYLEHSELGKVADKKRVIILDLFFWKFDRGIPVLSEIAAHAFLREIIGPPVNYIKRKG